MSAASPDVHKSHRKVVRQIRVDLALPPRTAPNGQSRAEVSRGESGCRSSFRRRYERPGMVLKRDPVLDQATRKHGRDRAVFLVDQGDHMLKVVAAKTGATEHVIQDDPR